MKGGNFKKMTNTKAFPEELCKQVCKKILLVNIISLTLKFGKDKTSW